MAFWLKSLGAGFAVAIGSVALLAIWLNVSSESTAGFARFASNEDAAKAAEQGRLLRFDVETVERRGGTHVTFRTGETGEDAEPFERAFSLIVESNGGRFAHPGGCTVKSFGD